MCNGFNIAVFSLLFVGAIARHISHGNLEGRIVGGKETRIEEFPHQVSLEGIFGHFCGGSVLSDTVILTAAHCVEGAIVSVLKVRAGTTKRESGGMLIGVERIDVHPQFGLEAKNDYDVAILYLAEPLVMSYSTAPAKLTTRNVEPATGTPAIVTGWGKQVEGGEDFADNLQMVTVPIVDQEVCNQAYHDDGRITPRMLCAGYIGEGGRDACQGDSGGPMIIDGKLSGIVSWGFGCAQERYPGVYTRLSSVRDWIHEKTGL